MKKIIFIQSDDWEALYINGILEDEGHELGDSMSKFYFMIKGEELNFKYSDIKHRYVNDDGELYMLKNGNFPKELKDFKDLY